MKIYSFAQNKLTNEFRKKESIFIAVHWVVFLQHGFDQRYFFALRK
jgi:hypothetical protein